MTGRAPGLFHRQGAHALALALLFAALAGASRIEGFREGAWLGLGTTTWVALAVLDAIFHQVWVWLFWRLELDGGRVSRALGRAAWPLYATGFTILIVLRPLLAVAVSVANAGTLPLDPAVANTLAVVLAIPLAWLGWSIQRHFGFARALGRDHFDPSFRQGGLVRRGIFRWIRNPMYVVGFFALWIPALYWRSTAGLACAACAHAYIWVHWFTVEKPDLEHLYGSGS